MLSERGAENLRCELVNASWPQQAVSSAFALKRALIVRVVEWRGGLAARGRGPVNARVTLFRSGHGSLCLL